MQTCNFLFTCSLSCLSKAHSISYPRGRTTYDLISNRRSSLLSPDPSACSLRPDSGPCDRFETRWYRDPTSNTCETFRYGGCGGNANNFVSRDACLERCDTDRSAENDLCNQVSGRRGRAEAQDWLGGSFDG